MFGMWGPSFTIVYKTFYFLGIQIVITLLCPLTNVYTIPSTKAFICVSPITDTLKHKFFLLQITGVTFVNSMAVNDTVNHAILKNKFYGNYIKEMFTK